MSTPDVKPDRLTRAKLAIDDFTGSWTAMQWDWWPLRQRIPRMPITVDYGAFHESLSAIDVIPSRGVGTHIASANSRSNRMRCGAVRQR